MALGGALLVTGPLRAAWVCTTNDSHWAALLPALLSLTLLLALLSFFTAYANPFTELLAAQAARPLDRQEIMANQALGITGILLQTGLMMGLLLLAVHRWSLKFGSLTLVLIISTALTVSTHTDFQLLPFVLGAGLIADTLYWLLKPSVTNLDGLRLFAFVTPAIFYALYFAALVFMGGIWWSIHIWSGTIVMAGIVGWLLSYAFAPPRTASE